MKKETKIITTYIADDGSKFSTEEACKYYEENCAGEFLEALDSYIKELSYTYPINRSNISDFCRYKYIWLRLDSKGDFITLKNALAMHKQSSHINVAIREPSSYPDLIAIELSMPHQLMANERYKFTGQYYYFNEQKASVNAYIQNINNYLEDKHD